MRKLMKSAAAGIVFTLALTGCRHHVTTAKAPQQAPTVQAAAPSANLTVSPAAVERGQTATLTWNTSNAASVAIDGIGAVNASGSRTITPSESTTYHLSAKGDGGTAEASARVTVNAAIARQPEISDEQLFAQTVKDVFFNYDNADILPNEKPALSTDLDFLARHTALNVVIEGHCDERGSEEYNMSLGESRAEQVKAALVQGGISADRIKIISYGKERPFCSTAENESCWQQNRRAHFSLAPVNRSAAN
jgi:peptidoglycan-associated lipoprotein